MLLQRRSHIKTLASVIDAGIARGHEVVLVLSPIAAKKGDRLSFREVELLWGREASILGLHEPRIAMSGCDALVGMDGALPSLPPGRFSGRMVGVDPFFDRWVTGSKYAVTFAWTSAHHAEVFRQHHVTTYNTEPAIVGWLQADQAQWIDPHQPRDSAVFFTLKMDVPEPWRQSADGRAFYRDVYEQARAQAKAEGLRFVVKSRAKNKDPWWVWWYADEYYEDAQMLPYTSMQLLARAKWCVHFESGAALEAALMGCYGFVMRVPQTHVEHLPGAEHIYGFGRQWPRMHAWPGVTQYSPPYNYLTVDPTQRQAYLQHFLGPCDGKAGQRVVEIAEGT